MEYEIEIDLGELGVQMAIVSGLIDSEENVTLTKVNVTIAGNKINVVSMLTESAKLDFEGMYSSCSLEDNIDGQHLYDEHDYS